jgi:putative transposase
MPVLRLYSGKSLYCRRAAMPQMVVHLLVKAFKGRSSHILRDEFPSLRKLPALWTNSYFVSTAGNVSSETIKKYIEAQATV